MRKYLKFALYLVIITGVAWFISYAISQYNSEGAKEGIFICNEEECFKTVHIHADITFDLCGESTTLPRESGELDGLHTHKEKNYLHFHDRLELDPTSAATGSIKPSDYTAYFDERLSMQEVIDMFSINPEEYCGTDEVTMSLLVNDETVDRGTYNWSDDDDIVLKMEKTTGSEGADET